MTADVGSRLLRAALVYAERRIPVFPLARRGKVPVVAKAEGGRGFHDATTAPAVIRAWWRRWPLANIGIPTGLHFDVLDVDKEYGGQQSLSSLEAEYGQLPRTTEASTGGGGRHILFLPDPLVRCSAGVLGDGLDVRGVGGYIVAPPSVHASGRPYVWTCWAARARWPAWLLDLIVPPPAPPRMPARVRVREDGGSTRYGRAVLRRACAVVAAAVEGTRHDTLRRRARLVAGFVSGGELAEELAGGCLLEAAAECGLPERESERLWAWALEIGAAEPLAAPERGAR